MGARAATAGSAGAAASAARSPERPRQAPPSVVNTESKPSAKRTDGLGRHDRFARRNSRKANVYGPSSPKLGARSLTALVSWNRLVRRRRSEPLDIHEAAEGYIRRPAPASWSWRPDAPPGWRPGVVRCNREVPVQDGPTEERDNESADDHDRRIRIGWGWLTWRRLEPKVGPPQVAGSPACSALSGRSDWTLPRATRASAMAPLCAHTHTGSGRRVSRGSPWDA